MLTQLRAQGAMADLDDGPDQFPLADDAVEGALLQCLASRRFDRIMTHSPLGEYTRHRRHEEVARAVLRLWLRGMLSAPELWLFAYDDDNASRLPRAIDDADIVRELSSDVWQRKHRLITGEYGFAETSWEARVTPKIEAFSRISSPEHARAWLERTRTP